MSRHLGRGTRRGGRTDGRIGGRGDDHNIDEIDTDRISGNSRRVRSTSIKIYGQPPTEPLIVPVLFTHILCSKAKTTLRDIAMAFWPHGILRYSQMNKIEKNAWLDTILREWHEGISLAKGDGAVIDHISCNFTKWMYELREQAFRDVKQHSGTRLDDHQPQHLKDDVWKMMCDEWEVETFKTKCEKMKKNKSKLKVHHTSGAMSFA